ncbi:unnamed protein product [Urochloa decumbens]|uniref:Uncharacterized protein n=1 Tax=Urochloa decumbens TaxID=240449 RepID=A0ABC9AQ36_9POAL
MAGGDDCSLRRCTAKSVEAAAAAATGPQRSLRSCSTKRKAKKEAASSGRVPRPRFTRRKAKEEAAAAEKMAEAENVAEVEKAAGVKNRLSEKEIKWFLAQKPKPPPPIYQALKRANPELTPRPGEEGDESKVRLYFLARAFYELEERLPKMQERVRKELDAKGYVEVDDEYHERKAKAQAVIDREWPEIEAKVKAIRLSQGCDESASEEEEEEDE